MRRLVLLAVLIGTASCSDDGFQLGSGAPDTDYNVSEVSVDGGDDSSQPDTNEEDAEPADSTVTDSGVDTSVDTSIVDSGNDTSVTDTGIDTSVPDTGIDTGLPDTRMDTGTPDTGTPDTGAPDTTPYDTGTPPDTTPYDTGTPPDTTPYDTGSPDTGSSWDTGVYDSGSPDTSSGDGGMCPLPPSTKEWDVEAIKSCEELDTQYKAKAQEARRCTCDADCSQEVAKDFCGCTIAVSPANDAFTFLKPAMDYKEKLGCSFVCPFSLCLPTVKNKCVTTTGGKFCSDGTIVVSP